MEKTKIPVKTKTRLERGKTGWETSELSISLKLRIFNNRAIKLNAIDFELMQG